MTRTCGRTTKAGTPCRHILQWYETACVLHATAAEKNQALEHLRRYRPWRRDA